MICAQPARYHVVLNKVSTNLGIYPVIEKACNEKIGTEIRND